MEPHTGRRTTEVIRGAERAAEVAVRAFSTARVSWCSVSEASAIAMATTVDLYHDLYQGLARRGVRVRALSEITKENLHFAKELINQGLVHELRHLDGVKGNFTVSETEYLAVASSQERGPVQELIYSNDTQIVEQNQYVFDNLWSEAIPAETRFRELEEGLAPEKTEVVRGVEETTSRILEFFSNAAQSVKICATSAGPSVSMGLQVYRDAFFEMKRRNLDVKYLTEITKGNIEFAKELMNVVELRHLEGIKSDFARSETAYTATIAELRAGEMIPQMLYTNSKPVVQQQGDVFDVLWNQAISAAERIRQLEEGVEPGETRLVVDREELARLVGRAIDECEKEIRIVVPSDRAFPRNPAITEKISRAQATRPVRIRVLTHKLPKQSSSPSAGNPTSARPVMFEWREVERPFELVIMAFDNRRMLVVEFADSAAENREQTFRSSIYTTSKNTIEGMNSFFDGLWSEAELAESERKSRRQAELLQDILAHDVGNYNQVSILSAELLKYRGNSLSEVERESLIDGILGAERRCINLVEKTKKLGRIISSGKSQLVPVSIKDSLFRSVELVRKAQDKTSIEVEFSFANGGAKVLADDLLDEAFINILTNSANYAKGENVRIKVGIEEARATDSNSQFWKLSFADDARGIPDDMKDRLFTRYLKGSSGSGLGLSIVYALVVDRYSGMVKVQDRVQGVHSEGTVVELWIPKG